MLDGMASSDGLAEAESDVLRRRRQAAFMMRVAAARSSSAATALSGGAPLAATQAASDDLAGLAALLHRLSVQARKVPHRDLAGG
jgi:hypothetical protein